MFPLAMYEISNFPTISPTLTVKKKIIVIPCAKSLRLCPTLATPRTVALDSFVHGIFQARILEWVAAFLLQ